MKTTLKKGKVTGMRKRLTIKQWKFANEWFLSDFNASEAYRRVYNAQRVKASTIHKRAYELMHHPLVAQEIREMQRSMRERMSSYKK